MEKVGKETVDKKWWLLTLPPSSQTSACCLLSTFEWKKPFISPGAVFELVCLPFLCVGWWGICVWSARYHWAGRGKAGKRELFAGIINREGSDWHILRWGRWSWLSWFCLWELDKYSQTMIVKMIDDVTDSPKVRIANILIVILTVFPDGVTRMWIVVNVLYTVKTYSLQEYRFQRVG